MAAQDRTYQRRLPRRWLPVLLSCIALSVIAGLGVVFLSFDPPYDTPRVIYALAIATALGISILWLGGLRPLWRVAERERRRSDAIMRTAADGIVTISQHGVIEAFNPMAEKIFGYTREEAVGRDVRMLLPAADSSGYDEHIAYFLAHGRPKVVGGRFESTVRRKDGSLIPVEITVGEGRFEGATFYTGIFRDITERRRVERALKENERTLREINTVLGEGVYVLNSERRIVFVNPAAEALLGWSAAELLGQDAHELFHYKRPDGTPFPAEECIAHKSLCSGEVHRNHEDYFIRKDGTWVPVAVVTAPIVREGQVAGSVTAFHDVTERKEAQDRIRHLAHHDSLTGLPNRRLLTDRMNQSLAQARRFKRSMAVVFIDLDEFKCINDTLGHDVGDGLLKVVATRLKRCVRAGDTVSRTGGDEFVIILSEIARVEDAEVVVRKVLESVAFPIRVKKYTLHITASIGISLYPADAADAETLMKHADVAMYNAKRTGKNRYAVYKRAKEGAPSQGA